MEQKKVIAGVAGFIQRKIIGVVLFVVGFAGLIVAELVTRSLSNSDTYYQQHAFPRLFGALLAFTFSYTGLKCIVWLIRWTRKEDALVKEPMDAPQMKDREVVGRVCYMPYVMLAICVLVAFLPE